MKYCQQCGKEIADQAAFCPECGGAAQPAAVEDSVSVGLVILAVLFPLFELIYWGVKGKVRPKCAKACGIAAIISWVLSVLVMFI